MVELSWHYMSVVKPKAELRILAELTDGTYISGYEKRSYDKTSTFLVSDDPLGRAKLHIVITNNEIKRWAAIE